MIDALSAQRAASSGRAMMQGFGPSTYGDRWADIYDEWTDQRLGTSTQATIDALAGLAEGGRALELAIGTGRSLWD